MNSGLEAIWEFTYRSEAGIPASAHRQCDVLLICRTASAPSLPTSTHRTAFDTPL